MPDILLHHYPQSPVSEKVRVVLGIKGLEWGSVEIPRLPPKPDLMPLTGGYRLTPVMQIGADVFCDSQCIIRAIQRRHPEPTLFPRNADGLAWGIGRWTDGPLFTTLVGVVLADSAEAAPPGFLADRGPLYFGAGFDIEALKDAMAGALAQLRAQFGWMDARLADGRDFMLGAQPGLPDAQCYYLVWFLRGRYSGAGDFLAEFRHLCAWEKRVAAIGHGRPVVVSSGEALDIAARARPATAERADPRDPQGLAPGETVEVGPDGVEGVPAVRGRIIALDADEIAILRTDDRVGEIAVHFPRVGYRVARV